MAILEKQCIAPGSKCSLKVSSSSGALCRGQAHICPAVAKGVLDRTQAVLSEPLVEETTLVDSTIRKGMPCPRPEDLKFIKKTLKKGDIIPME